MIHEAGRSAETEVSGEVGEERLARIFASAGWMVFREPVGEPRPKPTLFARRGSATFAIEVKATSEGRGDRLIPLWAQACLQAAHFAPPRAKPLAVVYAHRVPLRVAESVLAFAREYAPHVAGGVIDSLGLGRFHGTGLEALNTVPHRPRRGKPLPGRQANLFSDANQWMLKVLLAPEIPEPLLSAPRDHYRNAAQLARAAGVSAMSASRFVRQLEAEGYLHESAAHLQLVRRRHLLERWKAAASRPPHEARLRSLLPGDGGPELRQKLQPGESCLGLFAAAERLKLGFVTGVPPYVYVRRLAASSGSAWANTVPAEAYEPADLIVREAPAPRSIFGGAVLIDGVPVSDVLQTWLDVSAHPTRGREQADVIARTVLAPLLAEGDGE